jgi:hypothetical protein
MQRNPRKAKAVTTLPFLLPHLQLLHLLLEGSRLKQTSALVLTFTSADNQKDSSRAASEMNREPPTNIFTGEGRLATCQGIIENTEKKILHLRREQFNDIYTEFKQLCELSWGVTKGEISRFVVPLPVLTQYWLTLKTPHWLPRPSTSCRTSQPYLRVPVRNPNSRTAQNHRNLDKSCERCPPHLP